MQQKISINYDVLTGLFAVMLILLFFYDDLNIMYPGLDPLFMLFGQFTGLVFLVLLVFCIASLVLLIIRRLNYRE